MYGTPGRSRASPRARSKPVLEGPILEFTALIEDTPVDHWQKRAAAFQNLVDCIPHGLAYSDNGTEWYNTPANLRHLAFPIAELLKDARSTVVKRVCDSLLELFNKCQVDARYLFKDLMMAILAVHAQTVQVIRQAVQAMVIESIPEVPCKMVMPLWMERLKTDKSRTVREACALYLGRSLQCWTEEGYLTNEIWTQVGSTLLRSLRDPSPHVRSYAKSALEYIHRNQPYNWDALVNDPTSPAVKDAKLQKWLKSLEISGANSSDNIEELSIASRFSYNSDSRFATKSNLRISSPRVKIGYSEEGEKYNVQVPVSIDVTHKARSNAIPPSIPSGRSTAAPFSQVTADSPFTMNRSLEQVTTNDIRKSPSDERVDMKTLQEGKDPSTPIRVEERNKSDVAGNKSDAPASNASFNIPNNLALNDGQMILSTEELRKHAARRRSHSSIIMLERFRKSTKYMNGVTIQEGDEQNVISTDKLQQDPPSAASAPTSPASDVSPTLSQPPEHMVIAIRLLRAHKSHVDQIMETLKIEMDTLRDFDRLLEEPGRPTEEEVLDYFESVGLCLDQRFVVGRDLQKEMDRISLGEPPEM
jgi:CLASP N terminal